MQAVERVEALAKRDQFAIGRVEGHAGLGTTDGCRVDIRFGGESPRSASLRAQRQARSKSRPKGALRFEAFAQAGQLVHGQQVANRRCGRVIARTSRCTLRRLREDPGSGQDCLTQCSSLVAVEAPLRPSTRWTMGGRPFPAATPSFSSVAPARTRRTTPCSPARSADRYAPARLSPGCRYRPTCGS